MLSLSCLSTISWPCCITLGAIIQSDIHQEPVVIYSDWTQHSSPAYSLSIRRKAAWACSKSEVIYNRVICRKIYVGTNYTIYPNLKYCFSNATMSTKSSHHGESLLTLRDLSWPAYFFPLSWQQWVHLFGWTSGLITSPHTWPALPCRAGCSWFLFCE